MQTYKEECYFCGRSEDDEGVWLNPTPDGEGFICEECEQERERMVPPLNEGYSSTTLMTDEDTGGNYTVTVSTPSHAPDSVKITFGRSFSIQLDRSAADALGDAIKRAAEATQANTNNLSDY